MFFISLNIVVLFVQSDFYPWNCRRCNEKSSERFSGKPGYQVIKEEKCIS